MKRIVIAACSLLILLASGRAQAELSPETEAAMTQGVQFKKERKYQRAIERFREVTRLAPDYPDGFLQLGFTLQHAEKYPEAIEAYEAGLKLNRRHHYSPEAYYNMSAAADALNQGERALAFIKKSLQAYTDRNDFGGVYKAGTYLKTLTEKYPAPPAQHP